MRISFHKLPNSATYSLAQVQIKVLCAGHIEFGNLLKGAKIFYKQIKKLVTGRG